MPDKANPDLVIVNMQTVIDGLVEELRAATATLDLARTVIAKQERKIKELEQQK